MPEMKGLTWQSPDGDILNVLRQLIHVLYRQIKDAVTLYDKTSLIRDHMLNHCINVWRNLCTSDETAGRIQNDLAEFARDNRRALFTSDGDCSHLLECHKSLINLNISVYNSVVVLALSVLGAVIPFDHIPVPLSYFSRTPPYIEIELRSRALSVCGITHDSDNLPQLSQIDPQLAQYGSDLAFLLRVQLFLKKCEIPTGPVLTDSYPYSMYFSNFCQVISRLHQSVDDSKSIAAFWMSQTVDIAEKVAAGLNDGEVQYDDQLLNTLTIESVHQLIDQCLQSWVIFCNVRVGSVPPRLSTERKFRRRSQFRDCTRPDPETPDHDSPAILFHLHQVVQALRRSYSTHGSELTMLLQSNVLYQSLVKGVNDNIEKGIFNQLL